MTSAITTDIGKIYSEDSPGLFLKALASTRLSPQSARRSTVIGATSA